jgi:hypothetical protein
VEESWKLSEIILPRYEGVLYPMLDENGEITSENLKVHPRMKELYKFFKFNGKVVDIDDYDPEF